MTDIEDLMYAIYSMTFFTLDKQLEVSLSPMGLFMSSDINKFLFMKESGIRISQIKSSRKAQEGDLIVDFASGKIKMVGGTSAGKPIPILEIKKIVEQPSKQELEARLSLLKRMSKLNPDDKAIIIRIRIVTDMLKKSDGSKMADGGVINDTRFYDLIDKGKNYTTPIDADEINEKNKKGHTLDNLPDGIKSIMVHYSLFEKEQQFFGKVSDYKIAYHRRPNDKYWSKKIDSGERPPVLLEFDEENNQLRVRDGNHRLNEYLRKGIKTIPVILTYEAKNYLKSIDTNN
jgi:hypothetical protein